MAQYVDSAMVGSLGAIAVAAIGTSSSTIWLVNGIIYAFGAAFSVLSARQLGARNFQGVQHTVRQAILAIIAFSLVVTAVMSMISGRLPHWIGAEASVIQDAATYLRIISLAYPFTITFIYLANLIRSSGDTRSPLICNIITNSTNIILNFFLIFPTRVVVLGGTSFTIPGAGLHVKGAAIATAASSALSALILIGIFAYKESPLTPQLFGVSWKPDTKVIRQVLRVGTPLALERATLSFGQIILTALVTHIGTASLAAHHLAITAESITYMPVNGFSIAATTLVAQSLGAGRQDLSATYARRCLSLGIVLMSTTGALMFLFSRQLMSFFTQDPSVIALGSRVLRIEAFAEPFFAMSIVIGGILRGAGDTKRPFIYSLIGMWGVRILNASLFILVFGWGLEAAWGCMVADLVVRGVLHYHRYRKGNWMYAWKE